MYIYYLQPLPYRNVQKCFTFPSTDIAEKQDTKLHLAHNTGKRVQKTADGLIEEVKKRGKKPTEDEKATFFSDGNDQYTKALTEVFDPTTINYGQLIKIREKGRIVCKIRIIVLGDIDDFTDTVYIERYNLTLRLDISRLVRKTLCFSKCKWMLDNHLDVYQCYINLIRPHSSLTISTEKGEKNTERTPCMAEGITDHIWTWEEFLMFKVVPTT